jgi:outer membrane protein assembly factor BamB
MVDNENELLRVMEPYNVKLVFNGHGHQDLLWHWNGVAGTMNRGLYQGSYQRVDVDWAAGEVRLFRRTAEAPEPRPVTSVPLAPRRDARPAWAVPLALVPGGAPVRTEAPGAREFRWNAGAWSALPPEGAPAAPVHPGTHLLSLRAGEGGAQHAWAVRVAGGGALRPRWERRLSGGVMSHLRLADGVLFASLMDGSVTALRAADGEPLWRARTGAYCHSSPAVAEGRVIVGSADGAVYAFDARTGRRLWRRGRRRGRCYASAAAGAGIAAIASGDGTGVRATTRAPGRPLALRPSRRATPPSPRAPAATDGSASTSARGPQPLTRWTRRRARGCGAGSAPTSVRVLAGHRRARRWGGRVYVPSNDNVLHRPLTPRRAPPVWRFTAAGDKVGYSSPRWSRSHLHRLPGRQGSGSLLSPHSDGRELWMTETGGEIYDSSPAVSDGAWRSAR